MPIDPNRARIDAMRIARATHVSTRCDALRAGDVLVDGDTVTAIIGHSDGAIEVRTINGHSSFHYADEYFLIRKV